MSSRGKQKSKEILTELSNYFDNQSSSISSDYQKMVLSQTDDDDMVSDAT